MLQGFSWPRVVGLLLATVVPSTVAHWAAAGHVSGSGVAVLTVFTVGPVVWLGARRRSLSVLVAPVVLLQFAWHIGLSASATPGTAMGGHHGDMNMSTTGSTGWGDLLPDAAGWAMVAAHSAAALSVLLAVAYAESAVQLVVRLVGRSLLAALAATPACRLRLDPAPVLAPVEWIPQRPLPAVVGRRPLRRGPPLAAAA